MFGLMLSWLPTASRGYSWLEPEHTIFFTFFRTGVRHIRRQSAKTRFRDGGCSKTFVSCLASALMASHRFSRILVVVLLARIFPCDSSSLHIEV